MGFLRKVGRKIKKGVKKLFGSKLGRIVGMVGLYFMMAPVAKTLSNWGSSIFGKGAGTAAAEGTAVAAEGVASSAELAEIAKGTDTLSTSVKVLTEGTAAKGGSVSINSMMSTATSNAETANLFMSAQESAILSGGAQPTLSNTITGAVETAANSTSLLSQSSLEVSKNLAQPTLDTAKLASDVKSMKGFEASELLDFTSTEASKATQGITRTGEAITSKVQPGKGMLTPKEGISVSQAAADPARFATLGPDATMGERLGRFAQDPIGITRGKIQNVAADTAAYVTGPDFIPETIAGMGSAYVSNALAPEVEEPFRGGGIMGQPFQEQAQASHMQTVGPQLAAAGLGNVRSFSDLANQTLYGTGTPSYMQGIYQPLPIPNLVG